MGAGFAGATALNGDGRQQRFAHFHQGAQSQFSDNHPIGEMRSKGLVVVIVANRYGE